MTQILSGSVFRYRDILLLAIGFAAFAVGYAKADCGDYIIMGRSGDHGNKQRAVSLVGARHFSHHLGHPKPWAPCSGPNCSRRSTPPAPTTPSSNVVHADDWGVVSCACRTTDLSLTGNVRRDTDSETAFITSIVYHPPR